MYILPKTAKVATAAFLFIANVLQIVGLAASEWDKFDTPYFKSYHIDVRQSLWSIRDKSDNTIKYILPELPHTDWKIPIIELEMTGLACGVIAMILLTIVSTLTKVQQNRRAMTAILTTIVLLCAGSVATVIAGVQIYKANYFNILSKEAFKPDNFIPLDKYTLSWGAYICYASGGMYGISIITLVVGVIKMCVNKKGLIHAKIENMKNLQRTVSERRIRHMDWYTKLSTWTKKLEYKSVDRKNENQ